MDKYRQLIAKAQEPLTDKEYLDKFISDMYLFKPHENWAIGTTSSVITSISQYCAELYNFKTIHNASGKTYYEIPCKAVECVDVFHQQDRQIAYTRISKTVLDAHEFPTGFAAYKAIKSPIINQATNNIVGLIGQRTKLELDTYGIKTILELHGIRFGKQTSMDISNNLGVFNLTDIEREVLFCVCLGINTRKDVASFLSMIYKKAVNPETTVHDAFRRLYKKLNCNTPMQLLEIAVYNDLHLQIPQAFLPTGSYVIREGSYGKI